MNKPLRFRNFPYVTPWDSWQSWRKESWKREAANSTVWHVREGRNPLASSSTPNVLEDQRQRQNCTIIAFCPRWALKRNLTVVRPSHEASETQPRPRRWQCVTVWVELGHMMAQPLMNVVGRRTVKCYNFCSGSAQHCCSRSMLCPNTVWNNPQPSTFLAAVI